MPAITVLVMVGALLGGSVGAVTSIRASVERATAAGVEAGVGGRSFTIQAGSVRARDALGREDDLDVVHDTPGQVSGAGTRSNATIRRTSRPELPLGTLDQGRHPATSGEVTVSQTLLDELELTVGRTATLLMDGDEPLDVRIVGVTLDTADRTDRTVVVLDPDVSSAEATLWLSSADPYTRPALAPLMDLRAITYRSTSSLVDSAVERGPSSAPVLKWGPLVLGLLLSVVVVAVVLGLMPAARRTSETMLAIGFAKRRVWWTFVMATATALTLGITLGSATAYLVVRAAADPVSAFFGQSWLGVAAPLQTGAVLVVAVWLTAGLVRPAVRATAQLQRSSTPWRSMIGRTSALVWTRAAVGVATVGAAVVLARLESPPAFAGVMGLAGGVLTASAVPGIIVIATTRRMSVAVRRVSMRLTAGMNIVMAAAMSVALVAGAYSASQRHNVDGSRSLSATMQPSGSLLVLEVPAEAATALIDTYSDIGGHTSMRLAIPEETQAFVRVSSPELLTCMEQQQTLDPNSVPEECWPQRTFTPISGVYLDRRPGAPSRADPDLVRDGRIGLMHYPDARSPHPTALATTPASPDDSLGGNMPGLVVSASGDVAQRFGLRPSGTELVGFIDFGRLDSREQAQVRAAVARIAPAAQVATSDEADPYAPDERLADAVGLAAAAIVALTILIGGVGAAVGERGTLHLLTEIGMSSRQRLRILMPWVTVPLFSVAATSVVTWFCALALQTTLPGDPGWIWLTPIVAGAVASLSLILVLARASTGPADR